MDISDEDAADSSYASGESKRSSVGENSLDSIDSEEDDDMSDDSTDNSEESSDEENLLEYQTSSMIRDMIDDMYREMVHDMYHDMLHDMYADMYDDLTRDLDAARIPSFSALQSSKRQLFERPDDKTTVLNTMMVLNNLSGVRMWSPLYLASMRHIQADVIHREAFLAFSDPEDKVCYLECKTGKKRDE
ncbi:PREDICTED: uncharacterized protein LOC104784686 [Camelina sativa]|uniref:Uncharacterized protein LOC104784686 n=1 Tax=Camelina sativa TaxID=90675 RepID=A0ABM0YYT7_CAMSA|nr:PREDICTED: uncharacterized protein LOC104784686 [Camelina sativa]